MGLKEDMLEIRNELREVKQDSLAMEMYKDSKKANKRICFAFTIIILVISVLWFLTGVYLVKILNETSTVENTTETTQKISDIDTMNENTIINGDYNGNNKTNN